MTPPRRRRPALQIAATVAAAIGASVAACGEQPAPPVEPPPAATPDAGEPTDAGAPDAGRADAGGTDAGEKPVVSLARDVQPLLRARCGECHSFFLTHAEFVSQTSGFCFPTRRLVTPGDPDPLRSYVVAKVTGVDLCFGMKMPPASRTELSADEIDRLVRWIAVGAPDN